MKGLMWHKGNGEGVKDQGVPGPRGKRSDGATTKDGGSQKKQNNPQIRGERRVKSFNYIQDTDVNTPRTRRSCDGNMNMHITQTQEGFTKARELRSCDSSGV